MAALLSGLQALLASSGIGLNPVFAASLTGALQTSLGNWLNGKPVDEDLADGTLSNGWGTAMGWLIGGNGWGGFVGNLISNAAWPALREPWLPKGCGGKGIHW